MIISSISLGSLTGPKLTQGFSGLGALTAQQTYALARQAGFDETHARQMVAIAQRESALRPEVACINCAKDSNGNVIKESSIGLWQINTNDSSVWNKIKTALGITSPDQLKDPALNAQAAYVLWGGNDQNLNTAWQINNASSPFGYKAKYDQYLSQLPSTTALETAYSGSASSDLSTVDWQHSHGVYDPNYVPDPNNPDTALEGAGFNLDLSSTETQIAIGIVGLVAVFLFINKD
jgi:hypothetical protein